MSTAIVDTERQCPTYTHTEHLFGDFEDGDDAAALYAKNLRSESPFRGRKRVIQRLFNVGVLEAMSEKKASKL